MTIEEAFDAFTNKTSNREPEEVQAVLAEFGVKPGELMGAVLREIDVDHDILAETGSVDTALIGARMASFVAGVVYAESKADG